MTNNKIITIVLILLNLNFKAQLKRQIPSNKYNLINTINYNSIVKYNTNISEIDFLSNSKLTFKSIFNTKSSQINNSNMDINTIINYNLRLRYLIKNKFSVFIGIENILLRKNLYYIGFKAGIK